MKKSLCLVVLSLFCVCAFAGESHYGDGATPAAACAAAEAKAITAAKKHVPFATCYEVCSLATCQKKQGDGFTYYQCKAMSANTQGACNGNNAYIKVKKD